MAEVQGEIREFRREMAERWWLFLITGTLWILFSLMVLQFDLRSVTAIGLLAGLVFIVAGLNEFVVLVAAPGWRWPHALLGLLFIGTGILAVAWPQKTFVVLANLVAWFLLFKGTFDLILAFATKGEELWWARLLAGILSIVIAFWAAGYPGRSAVFLVLWVGISCLTRGITELITAFQLHGHRPPTTPSGPGPARATS
jgi:uncharacterized membrane protein HdeD (DUF308 family)